MKKILRKIPYSSTLYSRWLDYKRSLNNQKIYREVLNWPQSEAEKIIHAAQSLKKPLKEKEAKRIDMIESYRTKLLSNRESLVDGTFRDSGLYDAGLSVSQACMASKKPTAALFLYLLVKEFAPKRIIELGTNLGISSAYIHAAMELSNSDGVLKTLDASPYRQRIARNLHNYLGMENISYSTGLFYDTLKPALEDLNEVDVAFIDGHHQYQPTLDYLEEILPFTHQNTLFVFDDIRWSEGMEKAWTVIQEDERFEMIVDLTYMGICTLRNSSSTVRYISDPIILY